MGRPKALVELGGVPLVTRALAVLRGGGCEPLFVVLGAAAEQVAALLPADVRMVLATDWDEGMGASLRAGLDALSDPHPEAPRVESLAPEAVPARLVPAALVHLVDLPGVSAEAIGRLVAYTGTDVLARASYGGAPGHPVLLGRGHWAAVRDRAVGDAGARGYLAGHPALRLVECGDIAEPADVDTPDALRRFGVSGVEPERSSGRPPSR